MSVKEELEKLQEEHQKLKEEYKKELEERSNAQNEYTKKEQERENYGLKSSRFADKLYWQAVSNQKKIKEIIKKLDRKLEKYDQNQTEIKKLKYDTSFYIKEQVHNLSLKLSSFVKNNEIELTQNVKTTFWLERIEEKVYNKGSNVDYFNECMGTGNFKIVKNGTEIAKTEDYYFSQKVWELGYYDNNIWGHPVLDLVYSVWYITYERDFLNCFKTYLKENFESNDFKAILIYEKVKVFSYADFVEKFPLKIIIELI